MSGVFGGMEMFGVVMFGGMERCLYGVSVRWVVLDERVLI